MFAAWIATAPADLGPAPAVEVVATGVPRPLQLVLDGLSLLILSPGARGDFAGEIYRVDLSGELPVDLSSQPRLRIPFPDARTATLGSLALDPATRTLYLGEENGTRIFRLPPGGQLALYATGLHRLPGGGALALDRLGRLLIVDYVDQTLAPSEEPGPPGLEQFRDEDYRGPLVFRLAMDADIPLPRRLDRVAPLFPRAWRTERGVFFSRLISVTATPLGDVILLSSPGEVFRLAPDGTLGLLARLPPGHGEYNRTSMVAAPDGSVFVSGGFHVGRISHVSVDGTVTTVASNLADPEGIALDRQGHLYIAESSFHRIVRLRPAP